jgi:hypothetical protein
MPRHTQHRIDPVRRSPDTYRRYPQPLHRWAVDLGITPGRAEDLTFRDVAAGQWFPASSTRASRQPADPAPLIDNSIYVNFRLARLGDHVFDGFSITD